MNIVLLGATGFVGPALLNEALRRGHEVTAIVRHPEKLASQEGLVAEAGDVYDRDHLATLIRGHDAMRVDRPQRFSSICPMYWTSYSVAA